MDIVKKKIDLIVIILLSAIAISIYIPVIKEIISTSGHHDFQWSPTKIMLEKINHYQFKSCTISKQETILASYS